VAKREELWIHVAKEAGAREVARTMVPEPLLYCLLRRQSMFDQENPPHTARNTGPVNAEEPTFDPNFDLPERD